MAAEGFCSTSDSSGRQAMCVCHGRLAGLRVLLARGFAFKRQIDSIFCYLQRFSFGLFTRCSEALQYASRARQRH
jgi:hypothetical protein